MNLKKSFIEYCEKELFEINKNQLDVIEKLNSYYQKNFEQSFFDKLFKKRILS